MSSLAQFLLNKNYQISGSDVSKNSFTKKLKKEGCKIFEEHNENNITNSFINYWVRQNSRAG